MKKLITPMELADHFGVTRQTIYNWRKNGLPAIKIGSLTRYNIQDVEKWIAEQNKKER